MDTITLARLVKDVRDLQKSYFASGLGRFRDKKILAASKAKEKELDQVVDAIVCAHDPDDHPVDIDPYS